MQDERKEKIVVGDLVLSLDEYKAGWDTPETKDVADWDARITKWLVSTQEQFDTLSGGVLLLQIPLLDLTNVRDLWELNKVKRCIGDWLEYTILTSRLWADQKKTINSSNLQTDINTSSDDSAIESRRIDILRTFGLTRWYSVNRGITLSNTQKDTVYNNECDISQSQIDAIADSMRAYFLPLDGSTKMTGPLQFKTEQEIFGSGNIVSANAFKPSENWPVLRGYNLGEVTVGNAELAQTAIKATAIQDADGQFREFINLNNLLLRGIDNTGKYSGIERQEMFDYVETHQGQPTWGNIDGDIDNQLDLKQKFDNQILVDKAQDAKIIELEARQSFNVRGIWVSGEVYNQLDLVFSQKGSKYEVFVSIIDNNTDPLTIKTSWVELGVSDTIWASISYVDSGNEAQDLKINTNETDILKNAQDITKNIADIETNTTNLDKKVNLNGSQTLNGTFTFTNYTKFKDGIDLNKLRIQNLATPMWATDGANKDYVDTQVNKKQDKLIAGDNITIIDNTISATGEFTPTNMVTTDTEQTITGPKTFTSLINMERNKIVNLSTIVSDPRDAVCKNYLDNRITNAVFQEKNQEIWAIKTFTGNLRYTKAPEIGINVANKAYVDGEVSKKQDTLIAGTNITIENNTISSLNEIPENMMTTDTSQNIPGNKGFSGNLQCTKAPETDSDVTNKVYVDSKITDLVTVDTEQILTGKKTLKDVNITGAFGVSAGINVTGGTTDFKNNYVTGVPNPASASDAVNKTYADALKHPNVPFMTKTPLGFTVGGPWKANSRFMESNTAGDVSIDTESVLIMSATMTRKTTSGEWKVVDISQPENTLFYTGASAPQPLLYRVLAKTGWELDIRLYVVFSSRT